MKPTPAAPLAAALAVLCALAAGGAHAQSQASMPPLKVMSGVPADKASWKMEMLEAPGKDPQTAAMMQRMGPMTVCSSAAQAMSRTDTRPGQPQCSTRVLEDGASRATIEVACPGADPLTMKNTITRAGDRSWDVVSEHTTRSRPQPERTRVRMSYAGTCSEGDAVVKMGKDSPMCRQMAPQLSQMDPAKCPKGPNGQACVQQMTQARAQFEAMCK